MSKKKFTFIDLFAGIGGFHIAMHENGGDCVFASEIDKFARQTYEGNFNVDIPGSNLDYDSIPELEQDEIEVVSCLK